MEFIKKNLALIAALALPILMILFVVASVTIPSMLLKPETDFVYTTGSMSGYPVPAGGYYYAVENGIVIKKDVPKADPSVPKEAYPAGIENPKLYYHDVKENKSREISFEDAKKIKLSEAKESPDGFEVVSGFSGDFPFGGGDYNARYLKGHGGSKKVNLSLPEERLYDFTFLGWVTTE